MSKTSDRVLKAAGKTGEARVLATEVRKLEGENAVLREKLEKWDGTRATIQSNLAPKLVSKKWTPDDVEEEVLRLYRDYVRVQDDLNNMRDMYIRACDIARQYAHKYNIGIPGESVFDIVVKDAERLRVDLHNVTELSTARSNLITDKNRTITELSTRINRVLQYLDGVLINHKQVGSYPSDVLPGFLADVRRLIMDKTVAVSQAPVPEAKEKCWKCRCLVAGHHGPMVGCEGAGGNCGCMLTMHQAATRQKPVTYGMLIEAVTQTIARMRDVATQNAFVQLRIELEKAERA